MKQIDYNIVAIEAFKILNKIIYCKSDNEISDHLDLYRNYLLACGWDEFAFEQKLLLSIDDNWF